MNKKFLGIIIALSVCKVAMSGHSFSKEELELIQNSPSIEETVKSFSQSNKLYKLQDGMGVPRSCNILMTIEILREREDLELSRCSTEEIVNEINRRGKLSWTAKRFGLPENSTVEEVVKHLNRGTKEEVQVQKNDHTDPHENLNDE